MRANEFIVESEIGDILSIIQHYRNENIDVHYGQDDTYADICADLGGQCNAHAKALATILRNQVYDASPVMGKFKAVSDKYEPSHWDDDVNEKLYKSFERNGKYPPITHAWVNVKIDNKNFIADVTAEQFTHDNADRVVFTNKDSRYSKPMLGLK